MRVLALLTDPDWSASALALGTAAHGLSHRGHVVAMACAADGPVSRAVKQRWPRLSVRDVRADGWWRRVTDVRDLTTALRPDVMLVDSPDAAAAAALAMGQRGGVVQRRPMVSTDGALNTSVSWRNRTAQSRSQVVMWGPSLQTVVWPDVTEATDVTDSAQSTDITPRLPAAAPYSTAVQSTTPHVVVVVPHALDGATVDALRTLGDVRKRHPSLRVTLVAECADVAQPARLQDACVHAAAVGLATGLVVRSLDAWLDDSDSAAACWVVASGDTAALAGLAAARRGIPVIASPHSPVADVVVPLVTGLHSPAVVSDLARLIDDAAWQAVVRQAVARRAAHHFSASAALDALESLLREVAAPAARSLASSLV